MADFTAVKYDKPNRYCEPCGHEHGPLYVCPKYPAELQAEVKAEGERWATKISDPKWAEEQLKAGVPAVGIEIMRMFAGVREKAN